MRRTDLELLAALAAGTLPPKEAAALEARLATDPAARAEFEAQRSALAVIGQAARPALSATESERLRRAVASRIGLEGVATAPTRRRRRPLWGPVAVGASALLALLFFGPVADMLSGDGDAAGTTVGAAELASVPEDASRQQDGADMGTTMAPVAGGEDSLPTTTLATAFSTDTMVPEVAEDLVLLAADPEAVKLLEADPDEATPCRAEAVAYLGTDDITYFEYPEDEAAAYGLTYVVYHSAAPDGSVGDLVAFDPLACDTPFEVTTAEG